MSWIKRNLLFVIGSVIALVLLGVAGIYNYVGWQHNNESWAKVNAAYDELKRLNDQDFGSVDKVDNIQIARAQQADIRAVFTNAAAQFTPISPIPPTNNVNVGDFTTALAETVVRLQREASAASVTLPPGYNFSFQAQSGRVKFMPGSLGPLSIKLGEVAAICDVLFQARINALDGIRRERVSEDDQHGPLTDYLDQHSRTTELAVVTPYELSFRCFSSELAAVLSGFASSPHGLVVKGLNVEPALLSGAMDASGPGGSPGPRPEFAPPAPVPGATPVSRGGLATILNEKQLRITMLVEAVKLLPKR